MMLCLIVWLAQAVASTASVGTGEGPSDAHSPNSHSAFDHHTHHGHHGEHATLTQSSNPSDCCMNHCDCNDGHCTQAALLPVTIHLAPSTSSLRADYRGVTPLAFCTALFRPPIIG